MSIQATLARFQDFFAGFPCDKKNERAGFYFQIKPLGDLDKSCCLCSKTAVIDFDAAKDCLSRKMSIASPKSTDALKIMPRLGRLDFIELKGFIHYFQHESATQNLGDKIKEYDFPRKVKDSFWVLDALLNQGAFGCKDRERDDFNQVEKYFMLVVDIDLTSNPLHDRLVSLAFLSLGDALKGIPSSEMHHFKGAKLCSCHEIDDYYARLFKNAALSSPHQSPNTDV